MELNRPGMISQNQFYIGSHFVCLAAFLFPSSKLQVGGQEYTQYLLSSYPGWVFLGAILFLLLIEMVYYLKTRNWPSWLGFVIGLYCASNGIMLIWNVVTRFNLEPQNSLVFKLHPNSYPLTGLWMLAIGGVSLLLTSLYKILVTRSAKSTNRLN
jgi:hypothetical protein